MGDNMQKESKIRRYTFISAACFAVLAIYSIVGKLIWYKGYYSQIPPYEIIIDVVTVGFLVSVITRNKLILFRILVKTFMSIPPFL